MQEHTIYISNDGKKFDTKEECLDYERGNGLKRNKIKRLGYEKNGEINKANIAAVGIQRLKSPSRIGSYWTEATGDNIFGCRNLPRAEAIYLNAKKNFFDSLNKPNMDLYARASLLADTAFLLKRAIEKRRELEEKYKNYRLIFSKTSERAAEIEKEINELKKELSYE